MEDTHLDATGPHLGQDSYCPPGTPPPTKPARVNLWDSLASLRCPSPGRWDPLCLGPTPSQ